MKSTRDIWFSSYLIMRGVDLAECEEQAPRKLVFRFKLTDEEWNEYRLQFFSSESSKLKQIQERLKDLLY